MGTSFRGGRRARSLVAALGSSSLGVLRRSPGRVASSRRSYLACFGSRVSAAAQATADAALLDASTPNMHYGGGSFEDAPRDGSFAAAARGSFSRDSSFGGGSFGERRGGGSFGEVPFDPTTSPALDGRSVHGAVHGAGGGPATAAGGGPLSSAGGGGGALGGALGGGGGAHNGANNNPASWYAPRTTDDGSRAIAHSAQLLHHDQSLLNPDPTGERLGISGAPSGYAHTRSRMHIHDHASPR